MQASPRTRTALSAADVRDLRTMLEEQREFRIEQLMHLHGLGSESPLASPDPEVFRSLDDGARSALRDVQAALWRMDEGSYGRCTSCGGDVEVARLEILPQTATCLPCARAM
ncbi:TraR/DksA family transcriptional regulator [uncultured Jatrophihabitans sp.]|uniref:TraR/DksA family transcriptional regulator n=1 Tax=uncultured Jatrophihabitans sp. TaxID=1610747 RepID=UPI0035CABBA4